MASWKVVGLALLISAHGSLGTFSNEVENSETVKAIGATVDASVTVEDPFQANNVNIYYDGTVVSTVEIRPSAVTVSPVPSPLNARFTITYEALTPNTLVKLSVAAQLVAEDDGKAVQFLNPLDASDSLQFTLSAKECPRFTGASIFVNVGGCTPYQYNCESEFQCVSSYRGGNFVRTCGADAEWNNSTNGCAPELIFDEISKSEDIAVGCTSTISTSITAGTPISADYNVNWRAEEMTVASYSLTSAGAGTIAYPDSDLKGRINVIGSAVADMRVQVANLSLSDNGTVVAVSAMFGSAVAGSSNSTSLQVSECPEFPDASPEVGTCNPYHGNCRSTFKCRVAGNTFTATCLCNATFDSRSDCASIPPTTTEATVTSATSTLRPSVTSVSEGNSASGSVACCPRLDDGKLAAIGLGCIYLLLMLIVVIVSAKMEPKSSDHPDSVEIETSGTTQYIVFKYADDGVEKRTLKIDAGQYPNGSTSAITERTVVRRNCVGKISWSSDGDKNQAYMVLVLRERVVVDEKIVIGGSYMHWMASSCAYTYVIIPIGNRQIGKPVKHKTEKKRYLNNFWAGLLFIFSLILIIAGVALLVSSPNSDCCKNNCDACGLSPTGHGGFAPAILAILMLVILLVWMFLESCCPSGCLCCIACACLMCACCCCYCCKPKGKEEGSGNSEPEATRMMTENV